MFFLISLLLYYVQHVHRSTRSAIQNNLSARAASTAVSSWWLSYTHGLGRAGPGAGSEAGRLDLVHARWCCKEGQGPLHAVHDATYISSRPLLEYDGGEHKNRGLASFRFVLWHVAAGPLAHVCFCFLFALFYYFLSFSSLLLSLLPFL